MKTTNNKTVNPVNTEENNNTKKESVKANSQIAQNKSSATGNSNTPDWLMHLLTGAGALGGNYLLFVKPLQEKLEAMNQALLKQEKSIEALKEQVELLQHKLKKRASDVENEMERPKQIKAERELRLTDDLFVTKQKQQKISQPISGTYKTARL